MPFVYLDLETARHIHRMTIELSGGGATGEIEIGKLDSVLQHIQNDDYYPTFADKLTHLFFCACKFHCFADGNKRIAITLSAQMLLCNGYMAYTKAFLHEMENISFHVASGAIDKNLLGEIMEEFLNNGELSESVKLSMLNAISEYPS